MKAEAKGDPREALPAGGGAHAERDRLAATAAGLYHDLWKAMKPHFVAMAANCDLTLQQAIALEVLGPERSRSMSEIAETIACDASSATAIVDRLEARGLVERRSAEHDRRVKTVVLTPRGEELRVRFEATDPPPEILRLSDGDLVELCRLFRSMLGR